MVFNICIDLHWVHAVIDHRDSIQHSAMGFCQNNDNYFHFAMLGNLISISKTSCIEELFYSV